MTDLNKLKEIDYSDIPIGYKVIIMGLIEQAEAANAELARRDAAAGQPIAWVVPAPQGDYIERNSAVVAHLEGTGLAKCSPLVELLSYCAQAAETVSKWPEWKQRGSDVTKFTSPQPAALPPEMKAEPDKHDVIDYGFIAGYNKAIADAKALGCQPPKDFVVKLPPKSDVKMGGDVKTRSLFTGMNMMRKSCAEAIKAAGGSIEE